MRSRWLGATLTFKKRLGILLDSLLPLPNLHRMHAVFPPNLVDRLDPAHRLQTNLGLELWRMYLPCRYFTHRFSLPMKFPRRICLYCANDSDMLKAVGKSMQRQRTAAHIAFTPLCVTR